MKSKKERKKEEINKAHHTVQFNTFKICFYSQIFLYNGHDKASSLFPFQTSLLLRLLHTVLVFSIILYLSLLSLM